MSSTLFAFNTRTQSVPLSSLPAGTHAIISAIFHASAPSVQQLISLGVTPGALVTMMEPFPGVVFLCDETELSVERAVADTILVRPIERLR